MTDFIFLMFAVVVYVFLSALWAKWVQRVIGKGMAGFTVFMLGILLTTALVCVTVIKS